MSTTTVENLGAIFVDPAAYADPVAWHAAAQRIGSVQTGETKVRLPEPLAARWALWLTLPTT